MGAMRRVPAASRGPLAAAALLIGLALLIYRPVLLPGSGLPWGSDTMGHLLKARALAAGLAAGDLYPDQWPAWYLGSQMLRYYPPLPYYILAGLLWLPGGPGYAAGTFAAGCGLLGALGWLPFRRWLGLPLATAGGALALFLPDGLRVAFAEGNLPRALAAALLPWAVYCVLRICEGPRRRHLAALAATFMLVVLCHAMMAAIYAVACVSLATLLWAGGRSGWRGPLMVAGGAGLGLALAGWWLLPSLTGGITSLSASAVSEALAVIPLADLLRPTARLADLEQPMLGLALLIGPLALLLVRPGRDWTSAALTVAGLGGALIATPVLNGLFLALPLSQLLWPLRFLGVASLALLLALLWRLSRMAGPSRALGLALLAVVAVDNAGALAMISRRPPDRDLAQIAALLARTPGWRVATLDESRLGSAPTYLLAAEAGREQLFGWAYQGAYSAATVAAINEALAAGNQTYLRDRLDRYGVDAVLLPRDAPGAAELSSELARAGFGLAYAGERLDLLSRPGGPRALVLAQPILGIGRGAQNAAYHFPAMLLGESLLVDDYSLAELRRYEAVLLSGFAWRDREAAEALVRAAAAAGVRVVVDLSGAPSDPLARRPRFLGVWGEEVVLAGEPLLVDGGAAPLALAPMGSPAEPWVAAVPQGLDDPRRAVTHLGQRAVALGSLRGPGEPIQFLGLNLAYHMARSGDPAAVELLGEALGQPAGATGPAATVELAHYQADSSGYRFSYELAAPARLLVPVSALPGLELWIDGAPAPRLSYDRLVGFDAPAGRHLVELRPSPTPIYWAGAGLSLLACLALAAIMRTPRLYAEDANAAR